MADYSRSEHLTRRVEFHVSTHEPWGACWVEVHKAITAATRELWDSGRVEAGRDPADDLIRITTADDAVVVFYETKEAA